MEQPIKDSGFFHPYPIMLIAIYALTCYHTCKDIDHDPIYWTIFICFIIQNKLTFESYFALHFICIHDHVNNFILCDAVRERH